MSDYISNKAQFKKELEDDLLYKRIEETIDNNYCIDVMSLNEKSFKLLNVKIDYDNKIIVFVLEDDKEISYDLNKYIMKFASSSLHSLYISNKANSTYDHISFMMHYN